MKSKKWNDKQLIDAVANNFSIAGVIKSLGLICAGGNYYTIKNRIEELGLDTSHFTGKGWNIGERYRPIKQAKPIEEILVNNSTFINSNHLRERLLESGLKEARCECCGLTEWQGKPIRLEVHHINANHKDNRLENLQILCPNCHSLTDNYRGKQKVLSAQSETVEVEAG